LNALTVTAAAVSMCLSSLASLTASETATPSAISTVRSESCSSSERAKLLQKLTGVALHRQLAQQRATERTALRQHLFDSGRIVALARALVKDDAQRHVGDVGGLVGKSGKQIDFLFRSQNVQYERRRIGLVASEQQHGLWHFITQQPQLCVFCQY
jgi:hypothetical protein